MRELSVRLGVNYNTINKVYQDLERDGFIFTKRGRGSFVADVSRVDYSADDGEMEAGHGLRAKRAVPRHGA